MPNPEKQACGLSKIKAYILALLKLISQHPPPSTRVSSSKIEGEGGVFAVAVFYFNISSGSNPTVYIVGNPVSVCSSCTVVGGFPRHK